MLRFLLRRIILLIPTLIGISLVSFIVSHAVPADPVTANLGQRALGNAEIVAAFRIRWGLDQPLPVQYWVYITNLLQGDWGTSINTRRPVLEDLQQYLPATIELASFSVVLSILLGIPFGVFSALHRNRWGDIVVKVVALVSASIPVFWLGLALLYIFYYQLSWLPGFGRVDKDIIPPTGPTGLLTVDSLLAANWTSFVDALSHLLLPGIVLAAYGLGIITRITRASMLEALNQDWVRTARSKGLREQQIIWGHVLRNAMIPTITVIGLLYGSLLSGAVLTETVFAWPGLGRYAYQAAVKLDFPAIMGVSIVIAIIYTIVNLVVDISYHIADPRLSME